MALATGLKQPFFQALVALVVLLQVVLQLSVALLAQVGLEVVVLEVVEVHLKAKKTLILRC